MIQYENPMARPLSRREEIMLWGDESAPTDWDEVLSSLTDKPDECFIQAEVGWYEGEQEALGRIVMLAADAYENGVTDRQAIVRAVADLGELMMRNRLPGKEWQRAHEAARARMLRSLEGH